MPSQHDFGSFEVVLFFPKQVLYTSSPAEAEFGVLTAGFGTIQLCL
jgi:hypothetical protein